MGYSTSFGRIIQAAHGPPENELPSALTPNPSIVWRGDGIAIAVPSLLAYTTGVWLLIICRTSDKQPRTTEHARASSEVLQGLTVNGHPVDLLGGEHTDHGFTYRAWAQFREGNDELGAGIIFTLEWPGITPGEHHVGGLLEATRQVVALWPPDSHRG
jgi:hypothetical protein